MKKILYLGTDLSFFSTTKPVIHYPVIFLSAKSSQDDRVQFCLKQLNEFTHCLCTSKNSVRLLFSLSRELFLDPVESLRGKCLSIGPSTSQVLRENGVEPLKESSLSTQEGMIEEIGPVLLGSSYVFYPRSSRARPFLSSYLQNLKIRHEVLDLYDTLFQVPVPIPSLEEIEEIVFTSPSTVEGFFNIYSSIPEGIKITFQGPVTQEAYALY